MSEFVKALELKIIFDKLLGKAAVGNVYLGEQKGDKVAVKVIKKSELNSDQRYAVEDEIFFESNMKNENILSAKSNHEDSQHFYIVTELCDGNLHSKFKGNLKEADKIPPLFIIFQILCGLFYLQTQKCIHRELNPSQVLFKNGIVKLAAIGHFKVFLEENLAKNQNIHYVSPQLFRRLPYSSKTDVFSLGVIAYQLLQNGRLPWGEYSKCTDDAHYIAKMKEPLKFKDDIPKLQRDFIEKCLKFYEIDRMTVVQALKHPVFGIWAEKVLEKDVMSASTVKISEKYFTLDNPNRRNQYIKIIDHLAAMPNWKDIFKMVISSQQIQELDKDKFFYLLALTCQKQLKIDRALSDLVFQKLDVDESFGISLDEIERSMKERQEEIEEVIQSEYRRYCIRLYQYLKNQKQNISRLCLREYFFRFCSHDIFTGRIIMKEKDFMRMLSEYQEGGQKEIYPIQGPTKLRIFKKLAQEIDGVPSITYGRFQQHFVEVTGVNKNFGLEEEKQKLVFFGSGMRNDSNQTYQCI